MSATRMEPARPLRRLPSSGVPAMPDDQTREILELYARGLSTGEVAARLGVPAVDVRRGLFRAMAELGAATKLEAIVAAIRAGLVRL